MWDLKMFLRYPQKKLDSALEKAIQILLNKCLYEGKIPEK